MLDSDQKRWLEPIDASRLQGLKDPAVCRNIYGCRAAAKPWNTAVELDHKHGCGACAGFGSRPARLYPYSEFLQRVHCCPTCAWFFGVRDVDNPLCVIKHDDPTEMYEEFFTGRETVLSGKTCPLCSFRPARVAADLAQNLGPNDDRMIMYRLVRACVGVQSEREILRLYDELTRTCSGRKPSLFKLRQMIRQRIGDEAPSNRVLFAKIDAVEQLLRRREV